VPQWQWQSGEKLLYHWHQPSHSILKNFFKYVDIVEFLNIKGKSDIHRNTMDEQLIRFV
jgi:hypothetical protein